MGDAYAEGSAALLADAKRHSECGDDETALRLVRQAIGLAKNSDSASTVLSQAEDLEAWIVKYGSSSAAAQMIAAILSAPDFYTRLDLHRVRRLFLQPRRCCRRPSQLPLRDQQGRACALRPNSVAFPSLTGPHSLLSCHGSSPRSRSARRARSTCASSSARSSCIPTARRPAGARRRSSSSRRRRRASKTSRRRRYTTRSCSAS